MGTAAVQICRAIKGVHMDIRRKPGTTLANDRTRQVIYTPPEGEGLLREKLANWEQWMHGTLPGTADIDPLVRMAAGHYQFEAIHPFTDGNGRTGRVLDLLYLVEQGLLDIPVLYLSRHLLRNKADHYSGLQSITETARWTMNKIVAVRRLLDATTRWAARRSSSIRRSSIC